MIRQTDFAIWVSISSWDKVRLPGSNTVQVGDQALQFKKAVIATGARASAPPIPGLDQIEYLTNESIFSLTELPKRLGIIGAGPIGCEMAQSFALFGSEVFLVESTHGILPREDQDAAKIVEQSMLRDGVKLLCCGQNTELKPGDNGQIRLTLDSHDNHYDETVDQLLVAVGRAPNVDNLGLDTVGVDYDARSGVQVNDRLQTTNPNIYAAGDICSKFKFTHAADFQARIVIQNTLFHGRAKASSLNNPLVHLHITGNCPRGHVSTRSQAARHRHRHIYTTAQGSRPSDSRERRSRFCPHAFEARQ